MRGKDEDDHQDNGNIRKFKFECMRRKRRATQNKLRAFPPSRGEPDSTALVYGQAAGTERGTQGFRKRENNNKTKNNKNKGKLE